MTPLKGQTVVAVREATKKEMENNGFESDYHVPYVIVLSGGTVLMPSRDDEGNGPGTFFINEGGSSYYPSKEG